jgi:peptidoglycan hydrolase-like amidase
MNPDIPAAALATEGLILYDRRNNPVNPPYHSNCGGSTSDAAMVWDLPLLHLRAVTDPFCRTSRNASWETTIDRNEWMTYLESKGLKKEQLAQQILAFHRPPGKNIIYWETER